MLIANGPLHTGLWNARLWKKSCAWQQSLPPSRVEMCPWKWQPGNETDSAYPLPDRLGTHWVPWLGTQSSTLAQQLPLNTLPCTKPVYLTVTFTRLLKFRGITKQTEDWAHDLVYHALYVTLAALDVYFKQCNDHSWEKKAVSKPQRQLMNNPGTTFEEYRPPRPLYFQSNTW